MCCVVTVKHRFQLPIVAILLLLTPLIAEADSFHVTGATSPLCTAVGAQCTPVTYSIDLVAQPGHHPTYGAVFFVLSLTGLVDGIYPIYADPAPTNFLDSRLGGGDWIFSQANGFTPYGHVAYVLNGAKGIFFQDDFVRGLVGMSEVPLADGSAGGSSYTTWNIVRTPEPGTLLLLAVGLLVLKLISR